MLKQKWVAAQKVDPNIFVPPSKQKKIISIRSPPAIPVNADTASSGDLLYTTRRDQRNRTAEQLPRVQIQQDFPPLIANTNGTAHHDPIDDADRHTDVFKHIAQMSKTDTDRLPARISSTSHSSKLDVYAHKYVPYWLKVKTAYLSLSMANNEVQAINDSYATAVHAPQIVRIDYDVYYSSFAGKDFQVQLNPAQLPPPTSTPLSRPLFSSGGYGIYWQERLRNEYAAQHAQNLALTLFDIHLRLIDQVQMLYQFRLPGLREGLPRVDLGDILLIRPFIKPLGNITETVWNFNDHAGTLAPGFIGVEHQAVVWSIIRRDELVIVRVGNLMPVGTRCNTIVPQQIHKNAPAWRAIRTTGPDLQDVTSITNSWISSMLFPNEGTIQSTLFKGTFDLEWYDMDLNYEQRKAVQAVIDGKYGTIPYLISGPPGTGKTKTIVETALQLLDKSCNVGSHLLICAPSDAAADTLLVRLSAHLPPKQLFRLNAWTRLDSEVPGEVRPYCFIDNNQLDSLPDFEIFMGFRIVVTSCRDANVLITAGLTNKALASVAARLVAPIAPSALDMSKLIHWTALLIDEAAQATEPEVLIPISAVAPPFEGKLSTVSSFRPQLVMAGDEFQLGPNLVSTVMEPGQYETAGLEKSLFQRVFERPLYAAHPLSRAHGLRPLTQSMLPIVRPPFTNLIRNYRSHPSILSTSSSLFYSDTLIPERPETSPAILSWQQWPKQNDPWPVMFRQHKGADNVEDILEVSSGSLINHAEAQIVLDLVIDLLKHVNNSNIDHLRGEDIIVMSPFRAQVNHLRQLFREHGYYDIRIGPLEAFQGLESRVVFMCTTRTRLGVRPQPVTKFVDEDKMRNAGVIDQPKRFNVAMTRAMEGLVVIGDSSALTITRDPCWLSFLRFCDRNGLVSGGKVTWFGKDSNSRVPIGKPGKLELALRYAENLACEETRFERDASTERTSGNRTNAGQESFRFKLKGTMIDMDQHMWDSQMVSLTDEEGEVDEEVDLTNEIESRNGYPEGGQHEGEEALFDDEDGIG